MKYILIFLYTVVYIVFFSIPLGILLSKAVYQVSSNSLEQVLFTGFVLILTIKINGLVGYFVHYKFLSKYL